MEAGSDRPSSVGAVSGHNRLEARRVLGFRLGAALMHPHLATASPQSARPPAYNIAFHSVTNIPTHETRKPPVPRRRSQHQSPRRSSQASRQER